MNSNYRKNDVRKTTRQSKKDDGNQLQKSGRSLGYAIFVVLLLLILIFRLGYLQFIKGPSLKEAATRQQTTSRIISPNRGSIYDSTGKPLAISAKVDTVTINPQKFIVKDEDDAQLKTAVLQEKVSKAFSEIFELDYDEVYAKVTSNNSIQTIAKKVEEEKINKLIQRDIIITILLHQI